MKVRKWKTLQLHPAAAVAAGVGISWVIALVGAGVAAWAIGEGSISETAEGFIVPVIHFLALLVGGLIVHSISDVKALVMPLAYGAIYLIVALFGHILFVNEELKISMGSILAVVAAIGVVVLLQLRGERTTHRKIRI